MRIAENNARHRNERRKHPRVSADYSRCWCPSVGAILNVSSEGLAIETLDKLAVGESRSLKSRMMGIELDLVVQVRWSKRFGSVRLGSKSEPIYQVGLSIVEPQSSGSWQRMLEALAGARAKGAAKKGAGEPSRLGVDPKDRTLASPRTLDSPLRTVTP